MRNGNLLLVVALCASSLFGTPPAADEAPAPDAQISIARPASTDEDIQRRLADIFGEVTSMRGIAVAAEAGVVTLSGVVEQARHAEDAAAIARRTEGVVSVQNQVEFETGITPRLQSALSASADRLSTAASYLPLVLVAILIVLLFFGVARLIWARETLFSRYIDNVFIRHLLRQLAGAAVLLFGILSALELLDATAIVGAVLGAAGLAGVAIGFAFKDTIENYIAGILLSLRQPFAPHDFVAVADFEGHVARLTSRATVLVTLDGNYVRIPNARVFQNPLVNYTRNPLRRFSFEVGIGTDVDISAAQALARETLLALPGVETEPEPQAIVNQLGDSNVVLLIMGWVDQRAASFGKVRSEAIRNIKERFEAAEFDMPEPIYRLHIPSMEGGASISEIADGDAPPRPRGAVAGEQAAHEASGAAVDVAPERHMIEQVEEERSRLDSEDLLDQAAPKE